MAIKQFADFVRQIALRVRLVEELHAGVGVDSHFRYLSGLLLGIGLGFWSTIPRIKANGERFRLLSFVVVAGGMARLISLDAIGLPPVGMRFAPAMEFGVTPLLCLWQRQVGQAALSWAKTVPIGVRNSLPGRYSVRRCTNWCSR